MERFFRQKAAVNYTAHWLTQLRAQCVDVLSHPQLTTREALYALGTLLSKMQQCVDEDRLHPGLIESVGQGIKRLADEGSLQQQARQIMPIPILRDEARQQMALLWEIFSRDALPDPDLCLSGEPDLPAPHWRDSVENAIEPLLNSLMLSLVNDEDFFAPRCSLGETFARLSRYIFWFRQAAWPLAQQQRSDLLSHFQRHGSQVMALPEREGMTSDFYLLKGLALL